jgi:hypothetical protein
MPRDNIYEFAGATAIRTGPLAVNLVRIGTSLSLLGVGVMLLTDGIKGAAKLIDDVADHLARAP